MQGTDAFLGTFLVFIRMEKFVEVCITFLRSKPSSSVAVNLKFEMIRFAIAFAMA